MSSSIQNSKQIVILEPSELNVQNQASFEMNVFIFE